MALKTAWDPVAKGFRCYYTGVLLNDSDPTSPWYVTFDHRTPGKKGEIVVCAAWVNSMKTRLSEEEFKAVIIEFARCRPAGEPFNMAVAEFKYWKGWTVQRLEKPELLVDLKLPKYSDCIVCSERTYPYSHFCPRCRRLLHGSRNVKESTSAMQTSWDPERKAFICYLTGLALDTSDNRNPLFCTFDHSIPRQPGTIKTAAAFANKMKTALSEEEFWLVVKELANHFKTGKPFNKDIIKFAYWKGWYRAKMRAMRARKAMVRARRA